MGPLSSSNRESPPPTLLLHRPVYVVPSLPAITNTLSPSLDVADAESAPDPHESAPAELVALEQADRGADEVDATDSGGAPPTPPNRDGDGSAECSDVK
jgi:hypothetical protein